MILPLPFFGSLSSGRVAKGNALALLNFPKGTLFNRASWSIFVTYLGEVEQTV